MIVSIGLRGREAANSNKIASLHDLSGDGDDEGLDTVMPLYLRMR